MLSTTARLLLPLVAVFSFAWAEEHYAVYMAPGTSEVLVKHQLSQLFKGEQKDIPFIELADSCRSMEEAKRQAHAIEAGVSQLPCLVLMDEHGPFATLPLQNPQEADMERARALATATGRKEAHRQRLLHAHIYLLGARAALCPQDNDEEIARIITDCRDMMERDICTNEQRQFLGFNCLYPMLMLQYARGYTGAHTPYTEAKLLEAIEALETARDIDRETEFGKKAYAERERLRAARRKSREYE